MKSATIILALATCVALGGNASAGVVGYWQFEEGAGLTTLDATGNGHNGMLKSNHLDPGDPSYGPFWTTGAPAGLSPAGGLGFDGEGDGDYVEIMHEWAFDITGAITVAAWVNPSFQDLGWDRIVTKGADTAWGLLQRAELPYAFFYVHHPDGSQSEALGDIDITGGWHHVMGVFDASFIYLYVDGVLDDKQPALAPTIAVNDVPAYIGFTGEFQHCAYYNGQIDEVMICDEARDWGGFAPIPEPACLGLFGMGLIALRARKNRRSARGGGHTRNNPLLGGESGRVGSAGREDETLMRCGTARFVCGSP